MNAIIQNGKELRKVMNARSASITCRITSTAADNATSRFATDVDTIVYEFPILDTVEARKGGHLYCLFRYVVCDILCMKEHRYLA